MTRYRVYVNCKRNGVSCGDTELHHEGEYTDESAFREKVCFEQRWLILFYDEVITTLVRVENDKEIEI